MLSTQKIENFCGTKVLDQDDKLLPFQLASVIKKMMIAKQDSKPAVLRYANATKSAWKKAPSFERRVAFQSVHLCSCEMFFSLGRSWAWR